MELNEMQRTVLAEVEAETWRTRENGGGEETAADYAADIVRRLVFIHGERVA